MNVADFPATKGFMLALTAAFVILYTAAAQAAPKKCPPGSYWDTYDQMCIYANDR